MTKGRHYSPGGHRYWFLVTENKERFSRYIVTIGLVQSLNPAAKWTTRVFLTEKHLELKQGKTCVRGKEV
jgi:hypothetical protein